MLTRNKTTALLLLLVIISAGYLFLERNSKLPPSTDPKLTATPVEKKSEITWKAPAEADIPEGENGDLIRYGKDLIAHTAKYYGKKGKIAPITNGMNCQNCHLDVGRKIYGYNFSGTSANFPRHDDRSGGTKTLMGRVNDCFERSLNGKAIDSTSREMKAFVAYIDWIGQYAKKNEKPAGSAAETLGFLNRQADTVSGKNIYLKDCAKCHGLHGEGQMAIDQIEYVYPPLWGENSYNTGAGLGRLIRMAGFIKGNMPFGVSFDHAYLTDEQAWDVAAFVNAQSRPKKDLTKDWPDISKKPIDLPFGPYADSFSVAQHQLGPFGPIKETKK
jgi:thiosulfate dehydrogenase